MEKINFSDPEYGMEVNAGPIDEGPVTREPNFAQGVYGGVAEQKEMRVFDTGATRNVEVDPDYHGFLSPLALHAYGEYMHRHRLQADGTMRDSDNWQKGIPNDAFVRSLVRHVHDIQLFMDGYGNLARHDQRDPDTLLAHLSAALFNVQGLLHNVMDERVGGRAMKAEKAEVDYLIDKVNEYNAGAEPA